MRVGGVDRLTDVNEHEVRRVNRTLTSVTWLCEEKKTRAKGSERPLLSAANRLRAWYMCALSWNTCFTAGHVLKYQNVGDKVGAIERNRTVFRKPLYVLVVKW